MVGSVRWLRRGLTLGVLLAVVSAGSAHAVPILRLQVEGNITAMGASFHRLPFSRGDFVQIDVLFDAGAADEIAQPGFGEFSNALIELRVSIPEVGLLFSFGDGSQSRIVTIDDRDDSLRLTDLFGAASGTPLQTESFEGDVVDGLSFSMDTRTDGTIAPDLIVDDRLNARFFPSDSLEALFAFSGVRTKLGTLPFVDTMRLDIVSATVSVPEPDTAELLILGVALAFLLGPFPSKWLAVPESEPVVLLSRFHP